MKKTVLTGLIICGMVIGANAQTGSAGKNDPKAKVVLDGVSKKFKSLKSVIANFVLKVEGANNSVNDTKKGSVYVKGPKYKVIMDGQEIISDNKTSWTYAKDVNEVTISNVDQSNSSMTPAKIFTNFYDNDFLYRLNGETTEKGKVLQNIELTPTDKSKNFFKVLVDVDKKNQTLARMKVFEKNGNRYTYEILNFQPNGAVKDDLFTFDAKKYPGVEVVDLR
ncbi:outer membrane lipoprotein carrier protein LolA [Chitinophaga sp. GCM10012297]|uniref:Outer membrane lipoprotein carrier protein LolA n=1 Tax=Chitinophaga chungangae TaxID=2821488 RepID=A0ABS3Y9P5_9BACT|nr:outer membrane lipoprotein carrier protein LolA [Chitinophaga chungangae]MBO9151402.1 outer membrane lipoprotein carrier protein LolA [Chitinophaga chungangae]